jgi:hypothetical protein
MRPGTLHQSRTQTAARDQGSSKVGRQRTRTPTDVTETDQSLGSRRHVRRIAASFHPSSFAGPALYRELGFSIDTRQRRTYYEWYLLFSSTTVYHLQLDKEVGRPGSATILLLALYATCARAFEGTSRPRVSKGLELINVILLNLYIYRSQRGRDPP